MADVSVDCFTASANLTAHNTTASLTVTVYIRVCDVFSFLVYYVLSV